MKSYLASRLALALFKPTGRAAPMTGSTRNHGLIFSDFGTRRRGYYRHSGFVTSRDGGCLLVTGYRRSGRHLANTMGRSIFAAVAMRPML